MLKIDLNRIAKKKGYNDVNQLLRQKGYSADKAWRMGSGRFKKWELKDIENLCEIFRCSPDDLFILVPEKGKIYDVKHPMRKLLRADENFNVLNYLKSKSMDEIREIEKELEKKRDAERGTEG